jgi:hypothetical protein
MSKRRASNSAGMRWPKAPGAHRAERRPDRPPPAAGPLPA